jgi:exodeoxyribonuclease V alpha subunit
VEARTIHRLLEADLRTGGFKCGEENPLGCQLLVLADIIGSAAVPVVRPTRRRGAQAAGDGGEPHPGAL